MTIVMFSSCNIHSLPFYFLVLWYPPNFSISGVSSRFPFLRKRHTVSSEQLLRFNMAWLFFPTILKIQVCFPWLLTYCSSSPISEHLLPNFLIYIMIFICLFIVLYTGALLFLHVLLVSIIFSISFIIHFLLLVVSASPMDYISYNYCASVLQSCQ